MARSCARPACGGSATTTLSYDYANATVWIEPLHAERHPMHHDLCERHAARLSVPRGWSLVDRRADSSVDRSSGAPLDPRTEDDLARRGTDAWDPSGTIAADEASAEDPSGEPLAEDGAVVFEPTLFADWAADDDQRSLAS